MTALLILLLAMASVLDDCVRAGRRLWGSRLTVGLLVTVSVLTVLGVLVGWPVLHLRGEAVVAAVLMAVAWLSWNLVPRRWWARLPGFPSRTGWGARVSGRAWGMCCLACD